MSFKESEDKISSSTRIYATNVLCDVGSLLLVRYESQVA